MPNTPRIILPYWIIKLIDHSFFERDDGVICDVDVFRADFGAAFCDVAIADVSFVFEKLETVCFIERVHFETGSTYQEARSHELIFAIMVSQNMANVLTEEALNTLAKLLYTVDVFLIDSPVGVFCW
jgi:hypothetical protein